MRDLARRWFHTAPGVLLGALTVLPELVYLILAAAWLLTARRGETLVLAGARRLAEAGRQRIAASYGVTLAPPRPDRRALAFLTARAGIGVLGGAMVCTVLIGAAYGSFLVWGWFVFGGVDHVGDTLLSGFAGLFLLFLGVQGVLGVAWLEERLARHYLGPSDTEELQRRIGELADTRAGVVDAVHDERRRIERDLHDGVQQRLVALGMLLGRARRVTDPARSAALLAQAQDQTQSALTELRDVAWRIHPPALDEGGLGAALENLAERTALPVHLAHDLPGTLPSAVRTVAYFVAAEAVTNAVKHSGAARITVTAVADGAVLRVRVADDGRGGADPTGAAPDRTGLLGLARRVAAVDGRLTVDSPAGGPTVITAELPCA